MTDVSIRRANGLDSEFRSGVPELCSLRSVVVLAQREPGLYVRFSRGPDHDRGSVSEDHTSELCLPGISVNPLTPPGWWTGRPLSEWVARQLCTYAHLEDDGLRAWLVRGNEQGERGPDNEPLLVDWSPVAAIAPTVIDEARALRPTTDTSEHRSSDQPGWQEPGPTQPRSDPDREARAADQPPVARCLLAEVLGTFALTFVAAGTVMAGALSHGQVDHIAKAIAPGLVVMALIYAFGDVYLDPSRDLSQSCKHGTRKFPPSLPDVDLNAFSRPLQR